MNKFASKQGVELRRSYLRLATRARREVGRLIHGRGHQQAMRPCAGCGHGRVGWRDIERKIEGRLDLEHACAPKLERVKALLAQKPDDKHKIYALRAPEVECIAKGKGRTRYEFGVKTSIAVANARADGSQFVVDVRAVPGLLYDGHMLKGRIAQLERIAGAKVAHLCRQGGIAATGSRRRKSTSRRARASGRRPSSASGAEGPRSSRSSATRNPTVVARRRVRTDPRLLARALGQQTRQLMQQPSQVLKLPARHRREICPHLYDPGQGRTGELGQA